MDLSAIQSALREAGLDAWLFYDHHHRDPIAYRILGLSTSLHVTRRWFYLIPAEGEPQKLVHRIEQGRLDPLPGAKTRYSSWQELEQSLQTILAPYQRIAMQYSPRNAIMYVSMVDAGTIEMLREMGKTIVSSADLVSQFEAVLTDAQIASHYVAQRAIDELLAEGFRLLRQRIDNKGAVTEHDHAAWLRQAIVRAGLITENGPNVSVNANSSDSHYEPTAERSQPIANGDFLLIDIWARQPEAGSCWYDITWTGVVGREPTEREQLVFATVRGARDAAINTIQQAFRSGEPIAGWQADDAARAVIHGAGFGEYFTHRTGHNIAAELHGNGAHLDNLETHDERLILPQTCFSVEPGVYLPEFGVRSEINMLTSATDAVVTGRIQNELVRV
ncbi:M24 family metallopeptidase [Acidipila rosea]|uniref:Xaa-Pro aminopeptidase n=1 Tax=Acidipila rosea TaxID=768535 RepID=A0A4R1LAD6_9BACT|nr:M24 family metallopeptidase [Acidipila rosea]TCK75252.1 Xaa-Pro aminopeptidase [Acidipila rosea]